MRFNLNDAVCLEHAYQKIGFFGLVIGILSFVIGKKYAEAASLDLSLLHAASLLIRAGFLSVVSSHVAQVVLLLAYLVYLHV